MKTLKYTRLLLTLICGNLLMSLNASAHLMVAQQGTINIIGTEAFVVISIPISAFVGIDTNQDGQVSMIEFNQNRSHLTKEIEQKFILIDPDQSAQLIDILLSPTPEHHSQVNHFKQLTVMGKFDLTGLSHSYQLFADLFGSSPNEQTLKITVIRDTDKSKQVVQLTSDSPTAELELTAKNALHED